MKVKNKLILFILVVMIFSMTLENVYADDSINIIDVRKTSSYGKWISDLEVLFNSFSEPYEENEMVYVVERITIGTDIYLKCLTDYGIRYILQDMTEPFSADNNTLLGPTLRKNSRIEKNKSVKHKSKSKTSSGKHSRRVRITCYCKACNGNWGTQTASGVRAYVGGCAIQGVPFGTVVHTSYGDFTVIDRPGGSRVLDIYIGDFEKCHCSRAGYYGWETVTW